MSQYNIQDLLEKISVLESNNHSSTSIHPKVPLPEKFEGDRKQFRGFINQLDLVFMINADRYQHDYIKIGVIGTLLKGSALAWFSHYLENQEQYKELLNDYSKFKLLLQATFGEKDRALAAAGKLRKLRQGNRSAINYTSEFRELANDLKWNDDALKDQYRFGLSDEVKDMLVHYETPEKLDDFIALVIKIDQRIFEHRTNKNRFDNFQQSRSSSTLLEKARKDGPVPMEIDVVRRGPLSELEKKHRRENNLCMYCGGPGHFRSTCPSLPKNRTTLNVISGNGEDQ